MAKAVTATRVALDGGPRPVAEGAIVTVHLLGGFDVRCDGVSLILPLAGQRVVALLALHGRALSRAHVAGALWLDSSEERAAASLRSALWRIGLPGCPLVTTTRQLLSLAPGVAVDLADSIGRAHALLGWRSEGSPPGPGDEQRTWRALSAQLLPGWYDDWVIVERERFDQLRLHALEALCDALTAAGRYGPAVEAGHAAVAVEPLRESAHRALVRAHLAEGNRADALHQYELYRKLCVAELGCEPSEQMRALV